MRGLLGDPPYRSGMDRRRFVTIAAGMLAAPLPAAVRAQQPLKVRQIGCLNYGSPVEFEDRIRALRTGLRDYGYVEGKNITFEFRWAGTAEQLTERVSGYLAVQTPLIRSQRTVIAELSLKHRLAGMFGAKENVEAGGLMLYFADAVDMTRMAAMSHSHYDCDVHHLGVK
jgi:hypothetical protein